ncbi:MAG: winged helix-turn-helix transcriptional regulator [Holdemanella sp.]|nr:winged helix-turn-helix transcriptional regulator [Holdemanella sp.]
MNGKIIIDSIKDKPKITTDELADIIGKSRRTVQGILNELKAEGIIERIGSNKNGSWVIK